MGLCVCVCVPVFLCSCSTFHVLCSPVIGPDVIEPFGPPKLSGRCVQRACVTQHGACVSGCHFVATLVTCGKLDASLSSSWCGFQVPLPVLGFLHMPVFNALCSRCLELSSCCEKKPRQLRILEGALEMLVLFLSRLHSQTACVCICVCVCT